MPPPLTLRVRGPNGQATVTCPSDATVHQLQVLIEEATGVAVARQELLTGFPPRPLSLGDGDAASTLVSSVGIANGDSLTVRMRECAEPEAVVAVPAEVPQGATTTATTAANGDLDEDEALARAIAASLEEHQPPPRATAAATTTAPKQPPNDDGRCPTSAPIPDAFPTRHVVRRVVASDNSCLFNSIAYVMEGSSPTAKRTPSGRRDPVHAPALRAVVARKVRSDPATFTEAYLGGQSAEEYATWIEQPKHWGGAVELAILSDFYRREIAAYCIQTTRCDVYGEGKGYKERVMVIYDGLHYDALAVAPDGFQACEEAKEARDATIFDVGGSEAEGAARGAALLVAAFHAARQFTDTSSFTLRCGVCGVGLKGEKEAVVHASKTGHQNFQEY